jgi:hypothetical protein
MAEPLLRINAKLCVNWLHVTTIDYDDEGCAIVNLVDGRSALLTKAETTAVERYLVNYCTVLDVAGTEESPEPDPSDDGGNRFSDLVENG